jgi:hypothetical protein
VVVVRSRGCFILSYLALSVLPRPVDLPIGSGEGRAHAVQQSSMCVCVWGGFSGKVGYSGLQWVLVDYSGLRDCTCGRGSTMSTYTHTYIQSLSIWVYGCVTCGRGRAAQCPGRPPTTAPPS